MSTFWDHIGTMFGLALLQDELENRKLRQSLYCVKHIYIELTFCVFSGSNLAKIGTMFVIRVITNQ